MLKLTTDFDFLPFLTAYQGAPFSVIDATKTAKPERILLAITGASGSLYADRLLEVLLGLSIPRIYLVASQTGQKVIQHELKKQATLVRILQGDLTPEEKQTIRVFAPDDFFCPIASGSSAPSQMVVLPCSMGSLARICHGTSQNLIERSADVMIKSRKPLILCPRETPLSAIHLDNMARLANLGVHIAPPAPGFYHRPKTIDDLVDFMVGRILELLSIDHELYPAWNSRMR